MCKGKYVDVGENWAGNQQHYIVRPVCMDKIF
jgi:hypothetical protein